MEESDPAEMETEEGCTEQKALGGSFNVSSLPVERFSQFDPVTLMKYKYDESKRN